MPIVFGPNYLKFNEAKTMVNLGVAFPVNDSPMLNNTLHQLLSNKEKRNWIASECNSFTNQNLGATQIILNKVFNKL
jgi:3-deoxy-D-manno-octulosonic-acid transferase